MGRRVAPLVAVAVAVEHDLRLAHARLRRQEPEHAEELPGVC
ncbi:hypothetical protein [Microbispora hainanensis]